MASTFRLLNRLRLDRKWSWKQLAAEMARVLEVAIPPRTVYHLLAGAPETFDRARATTRHQFELFVAHALAKGWITDPDPEGEAYAAPVLRSHDARPGR